MSKINLDKLLAARDMARKGNDFAKSDRLRDEIAALGYTVEDTPSGTIVKEIVQREANENTYLTVFGSGETSSIGRKIHEYVLTNLNKKQVNIGIITTPAGFQPNVVIVHEEIKTFFLKHLTNFNPLVKIIYANSKEDTNNPHIVAEIESCDYLFMGPGSPTYAVTHLKDSLLLEKLREKITNQNISLCLSSAAALAFSRYCLPVYEIYKVGTPLHWIDGLDFYQTILGEQLTVIPHFDNSEGGVKNDTAYCFMGEKRFRKLTSLLQRTDKIIGIDEQTAGIWNLQTKVSLNMGKGNITTVQL